MGRDSVAVGASVEAVVSSVVDEGLQPVRAAGSSIRSAKERDAARRILFFMGEKFLSIDAYIIS
jgi:hypothetical protein